MLQGELALAEDAVGQVSLHDAGLAHGQLAVGECGNELRVEKRVIAGRLSHRTPVSAGWIACPWESSVAATSRLTGLFRGGASLTSPLPAAPFLHALRRAAAFRPAPDATGRPPRGRPCSG